jgi:hypothetical protein
MKNFILIAFVCSLLASCRTGNSITKNTGDKALSSAVKKLNKNPNNVELQNALSSLYNDAAKNHLDKIEVYSTLTEVDRWDKIIKEYKALKSLSDVIISSGVANGLIKAPSYTSELQSALQNGAGAYYESGETYFINSNRESFKNAYYAFKKANDFVPGFKDSRDKMDIAYKSSVIKVVINPVADNSFYYNSVGFNNFGNSFNNDNFQRSLVRDLGGNFNKNSPALFYTDWEARRENIRPDWEIDLTWLDINIPHPSSNQYSRNISRQIEAGRDTSGKIVYETVHATLHVIRKYFTAYGELEFRIMDIDSRRTISNDRFRDQFNFQEEYATYSGDSRALSGSDWALINNNRYHIPNKEDILSELYQRIYPQVKNRIYSAVSW